MFKQLVCQKRPHLEQSIFHTFLSDTPQGQVSIFKGSSIFGGDELEVTSMDDVPVRFRLDGWGEIESVLTIFFTLFR